MNVIDALKRLERAGSENSRATAKLMEAAGAVSAVVVAMVPSGIDLPQRYMVRAGALASWAPWEDGGMVRVDRDRDRALAFARDIAEGWLGELAEWLEARVAEAAAATAILEAAKP